MAPTTTKPSTGSRTHREWWAHSWAVLQCTTYITRKAHFNPQNIFCLYSITNNPVSRKSKGKFFASLLVVLIHWEPYAIASHFTAIILLMSFFFNNLIVPCKQTLSSLLLSLPILFPSKFLCHLCPNLHPLLSCALFIVRNAMDITSASFSGGPMVYHRSGVCVLACDYSMFHYSRTVFCMKVIWRWEREREREGLLLRKHKYKKVTRFIVKTHIIRLRS